MSSFASTETTSTSTSTSSSTIKFKLKILLLPQRQQHIVNIDGNAALQELQQMIEKICSIECALQILSHGFPAQVIPTQSHEERQQTLVQATIHNGDTISVQQYTEDADEDEEDEQLEQQALISNSNNTTTNNNQNYLPSSNTFSTNNHYATQTQSSTNAYLPPNPSPNTNITSSSTYVNMPPSSSTTTNDSSDTFNCPRCTYANLGNAPYCEMCNERNPNVSQSPYEESYPVDEDGVRAPMPQMEEQLIGGPSEFPFYSSLFPPSNANSSRRTPEMRPTNANDTDANESPPSAFSLFNRPPTPRWNCERCQADNHPNLICCKRCRLPNLALMEAQQASSNNCLLM